MRENEKYLTKLHRLNYRVNFGFQMKSKNGSDRCGCLVFITFSLLLFAVVWLSLISTHPFRLSPAKFWTSGHLRHGDFFKGTEISTASV